MQESLTQGTCKRNMQEDKQPSWYEKVFWSSCIVTLTVGTVIDNYRNSTVVMKTSEESLFIYGVNMVKNSYWTE